MTDLSSVSGLRGVREALAELFELVESGELVRDISRDGESDWLRRAAKLTLTLKKAQLALSLPPSPQATPCGIIGYPEQGRQVCELLAGHEGYHRQDGVRWLGCWKPWDVTPQAPAGAQGQVQGVQARPPMSIGKNAAGEMHLSASGYCSACNMLVEFGTDDCPHAKTMYGRAVPPADVSSQAGQEKRAMHPNRKDAITHEQARKSLQRFVNLHFHNAGEKSRASIPAHQDDDDILLSDYISQQEAAAPSAGSGQEGLREALRELLSKFECFAVRHMVSSDESELTGEFRWWPKRGNDAFITDEKYRELAALLPPASKPPAATLNPEQYLKLALRIQNIGKEHPYTLECIGSNTGMWVCQCGEVLGDQPVDEIDAVASQHICEVVAELLRRASLERESK